MADPISFLTIVVILGVLVMAIGIAMILWLSGKQEFVLYLALGIGSIILTPFLYFGILWAVTWLGNRE